MPTRGAWLSKAMVPAVLVVPVLLGGCIGGGDDAAFTMGELGESGTACPVDLDTAVVEAGLAADGEATSATAEVMQGSGDGGQDASALDQVGGVYVECTRSIDGGEATAVLFASEQPQAVGLLLPQLARDLDLGADELTEVVSRYDDTDQGELVDLGVAGPAAMARLEIDDAESAVLYVSAPQASPDQVQAIAEDLLRSL